MNQKTAKQLRRASAALAMIAVAEWESRNKGRLGPEQRFTLVRNKTAQAYQNLKSRWQKLPAKERRVLRLRLLSITDQVLVPAAA